MKHLPQCSTNWTQKQIYVPVFFFSFPFYAYFEGDFEKCIYFLNPGIPVIQNLLVFQVFLVI